MTRSKLSIQRIQEVPAKLDRWTDRQADIKTDGGCTKRSLCGTLICWYQLSKDVCKNTFALPFPSNMRIGLTFDLTPNSDHLPIKGYLYSPTLKLLGQNVFELWVISCIYKVWETYMYIPSHWHTCTVSTCSKQYAPPFFEGGIKTATIILKSFTLGVIWKGLITYNHSNGVCNHNLLQF